MASRPDGTDASSLLMASLPAAPILTYPSWTTTLRVAWDVTTAVSDEAVDTIKTIGADRGVAESAGYEVRSWMATASAAIKGVVYVAALMFGAFALWRLAASLRKFWPTWPSQHAHAQMLRDASGSAGYAPEASLGVEIQR